MAVMITLGQEYKLELRYPRNLETDNNFVRRSRVTNIAYFQKQHHGREHFL